MKIKVYVKIVIMIISLFVFYFLSNAYLNDRDIRLKHQKEEDVEAGEDSEEEEDY